MSDLRAAVEEYNGAWNEHDVDAVVAMHAPHMVFENHTAGEVAEGEEVRAKIASIFETWPDLSFEVRRFYVRRDLVVQEWTATATHSGPVRRSGFAADPSGRRVTWKGMDVMPFEGGLIARKDVYSDSVAILRGVGALDD